MEQLLLRVLLCVARSRELVVVICLNFLSVEASRSMVKRYGELCYVMVAIVLNDIRFLLLMSSQSAF